MKRKINHDRTWTSFHWNLKDKILKIPAHLLKYSENVELDLEIDVNGTGLILGRNSRCVSVATFLIAPEGRNEKKELITGSYAQLDFFLTFINPNTKEIQPDPCVNKLW